MLPILTHKVLRVILVALFIAATVFFGIVFIAHAQIVPAQNQQIISPYGGFIVATSTSATSKLSATSTPYFANFFANIGHINTLFLPNQTSALLQTDGSGQVSEYAGTTCLNSFVRALSALGIAVCDQVDINNDTTGTLIATRGGTGIDTYVAGDLIYADGANHLGPLAVGGDGQFLTVSGGFPAWGAVTVTTPGGPDKSVQFNNGGSFAGVAGLLFDGAGTLDFDYNGGATGSFSVLTQSNASTISATDAGVVTVGGQDTNISGSNLILTGSSVFAMNAGGDSAQLNFSNLTADRLFAFPNVAGTFCVVGVFCDGAGGSGTIATSSNETATYIPYWTSTNGYPALLSGGEAAFVYSAASDRLSVTNASTTAFSSVYASSTAGFFGSATIGAITGVLKATAGLVAQAIAGTDYVAGGTGANTQVTYFTAAGVIAGDSGMTYDAAADRLTVVNASTTALSTAYASSTNAFFGTLSLTNPLTVANGGTGRNTLTISQLLYGSGTNGVASVATTTLAGTGVISVSNSPVVIGTSPAVISCSTCLAAAITSIGPIGALQTGPAVTLATSSVAFNGLTASTTITASTNTVTFTNTLAGILGVGGGGTGVVTLTGLVKGNGTSPFSAAAAGTDYVAGGTGANTQVTYFTGSGAIAGDAGMTYVASTDVFTVVNASTTALSTSYASSTTGFFGNATIGSASGVVIRTSGLIGTGVDGTDYTLTNAITCTAGDFISAVTAAGVSTCTTPAGGSANSKWATSTLPALGIYPNSALYVGIGTTTPRWNLQLASSTAAQLALSDGTLTSNHWVMRNGTGTLWFATSSPSTFATSSIPTFTLGPGGVSGFAGIGTAAPAVPLDIFQDINNFTAVRINNPNAGASASTRLLFGNDGGANGQMILTSSTAGGAVGPNSFSFYNNANGPLIFFTNAVEKMRILSNGNVGIGTSTPWGELSVASTTFTDYSVPLFTVATSSDSFGQLITVMATSSLQNLIGINSNWVESGVRTIIGGLSKLFTDTGVLDQLSVNGRINQDWGYIGCDAAGANTNYGTNAAATWCGGLAVDIAGGGGTGMAATSMTIGEPGSSGIRFNSSGTSATGGGLLAGSGTPSSGSQWLIAATSTPVMEVIARITTVQNATSTDYRIGFTNATGVGFSTAPTAGCFFAASSTQANWQALCGSGSTFTQVNTNVASTTVTTGVGAAYVFRVQMDNEGADFWIKSAQNGSLVKVARITTNYPATAALAASAHWRITTAGLTKSFDILGFRLWWQRVLPQI